MSKKFIILGAGPCGLATAFGLTLNEIDLEVYEARDVVGGLGGSEEVDGMVFDYGPHIYHTHDSEMKKFWLDNFEDLLIQKEFLQKIIKMGFCMIIHYPKSQLKNFPKKLKKKLRKS